MRFDLNWMTSEVILWEMFEVTFQLMFEAILHLTLGDHFGVHGMLNVGIYLDHQSLEYNFENLK